MKKFLTFVLLIITINYSTIGFVANATTETEKIISTSIEVLENGDYIETTLSITTSNTRATNTTSGVKSSKYKDSNGNTLWYIRLRGNFSYNGTTAVCTSKSHSAKSLHSDWTIKSASSSKSGNTASATATATMNSTDHTRSVKITCYPDGTYS